LQFKENEVIFSRFAALFIFSCTIMVLSNCF